MLIEEAHTGEARAAPERGEQNSPKPERGAEIDAAACGQTKAEVLPTMEAVITRENLMQAYQRVVETKGRQG